MIDVDELEDLVREEILENASIEELKNMSVYEAFDKFLLWNGIFGYTAVIMEALDNIRAASDE